jgi:hypothetical protein
MTSLEMIGKLGRHRTNKVACLSGHQCWLAKPENYACFAVSGCGAGSFFLRRNGFRILDFTVHVDVDRDL